MGLKTCHQTSAETLFTTEFKNGKQLLLKHLHSESKNHAKHIVNDSPDQHSQILGTLSIH